MFSWLREPYRSPISPYEKERPLIRILTAGFTIERTHYLYQDVGRVFLIASSYLLMKTNVNYRNFVESYLTYTKR